MELLAQLFAATLLTLLLKGGAVLLGLALPWVLAILIALVLVFGGVLIIADGDIW